MYSPPSVMQAPDSTAEQHPQASATWQRLLPQDSAGQQELCSGHPRRLDSMLACSAQSCQLQALTLYLRMKASIPFLDSMAARSFSGLKDGDDLAGDTKACMCIGGAGVDGHPQVDPQSNRDTLTKVYLATGPSHSQPWRTSWRGTERPACTGTAGLEPTTLTIKPGVIQDLTTTGLRGWA